MVIIKVWCLSVLGESESQKLHKAIVKAVCNVAELGLNDESDITVLFPAVLKSYSLTELIIVEITGLFKKPEYTKEVRDRLAENVGSAIKVRIPKSNVRCSESSLDREKGGFWTNEG